MEKRKRELAQLITATTTDLGIGLNGKFVFVFGSFGITGRLRIFNPKPAVVPRRCASAYRPLHKDK